jgi:Icc-related predicted phosphoesterase
VELPGESDLEPVCERARRQLRRLATPRDRIVLMTHYPPLSPGLFPPRVGARADSASESIARLVDEIKPILIVQGHEHRWSGLIGRRNSALVINPGREGMIAVVDTETNHAEIEP